MPQYKVSSYNIDTNNVDNYHFPLTNDNTVTGDKAKKTNRFQLYTDIIFTASSSFDTNSVIRTTKQLRSIREKGVLYTEYLKQRELEAKKRDDDQQKELYLQLEQDKQTEENKDVDQLVQYSEELNSIEEVKFDDFDINEKNYRGLGINNLNKDFVKQTRYLKHLIRALMAAMAAQNMRKISEIAQLCIANGINTDDLLSEIKFKGKGQSISEYREKLNHVKKLAMLLSMIHLKTHSVLFIDLTKTMKSMVNTMMQINKTLQSNKANIYTARQSAMSSGEITASLSNKQQFDIASGNIRSIDTDNNTSIYRGASLINEGSKNTHQLQNKDSISDTNSMSSQINRMNTISTYTSTTIPTITIPQQQQPISNYQTPVVTATHNANLNTQQLRPAHQSMNEQNTHRHMQQNQFNHQAATDVGRNNMTYNIKFNMPPQHDTQLKTFAALRHVVTADIGNKHQPETHTRNEATTRADSYQQHFQTYSASVYTKTIDFTHMSTLSIVKIQNISTTSGQQIDSVLSRLGEMIRSLNTMTMALDTSNTTLTLMSSRAPQHQIESTKASHEHSEVLDRSVQTTPK